MLQGYIFVAHLDNPQLYQIFEAILKKKINFKYNTSRQLILPDY